MSDIEFPKGIFFKERNENAPDFVHGTINFKVDEAIDWLRSNADSGGWVNVQLLTSKAGKKYLKKDNWKPDASRQSASSGPSPGDDRPPPRDADFDEAIPF
jgi:hypothetical protein